MPGSFRKSEFSSLPNRFSKENQDGNRTDAKIRQRR